MTFEPIELPDCRIVRFSDAHLTQRYVDWLNDPETVRYSELRHRHHDLAGCASYAASFAGSLDLFLAIEARDAGLGHIGNLTVAADGPNRSADVSIVVGEPKARGTGIGAQAWCGIVDWLLDRGCFRRVTAGTMACNAPMLALMRRSAMTVEAVRPRAFLLDGAEVDLVLAARFSDRALPPGAME